MAREIDTQIGRLHRLQSRFAPLPSLTEITAEARPAIIAHLVSCGRLKPKDRDYDFGEPCKPEPGDVIDLCPHYYLDYQAYCAKQPLKLGDLYIGRAADGHEIGYFMIRNAPVVCCHPDDNGIRRVGFLVQPFNNFPYASLHLWPLIASGTTLDVDKLKRTISPRFTIQDPILTGKKRGKGRRLFDLTYFDRHQDIRSMYQGTMFINHNRTVWMLVRIQEGQKTRMKLMKVWPPAKNYPVDYPKGFIDCFRGADGNYPYYELADKVTADMGEHLVLPRPGSLWYVYREEEVRAHSNGSFEHYDQSTFQVQMAIIGGKLVKVATYVGGHLPNGFIPGRHILPPELKRGSLDICPGQICDFHFSPRDYGEVIFGPDDVGQILMEKLPESEGWGWSYFMVMPVSKEGHRFYWPVMICLSYRLANDAPIYGLANLPYIEEELRRSMAGKK